MNLKMGVVEQLVRDTVSCPPGTSVLTRSDSFSQTILNRALMSTLKRHLFVVVLKLPIASAKVSIITCYKYKIEIIKLKLKLKTS